MRAYFSPRSAKEAKEIMIACSANAEAHAEEFSDQNDEWYEFPDEAPEPQESNPCVRLSACPRTSLPPTPLQAAILLPSATMSPADVTFQALPPTPRDLQNTQPLVSGCGGSGVSEFSLEGTKV